MKIKVIILKMGIRCLSLFYFVMKLMPIQKKVVFISRQTDSVHIDFNLINDELLRRNKAWKSIILTKKIGGKAVDKFKYIFHMFRQMYHIATAKVVVIDGYCIAVSVLKHKKALTIIQIWHAIGCMKKFGYAMIGQEEGHSKELAKVMKMHMNYDWALISSYSFINDYIEGFHILPDKVLQIPLPKADLLMDEEYAKRQREKLIAEYPELSKKKNILYCPTFRKNEDNSVGADKLADKIDFSKYNFIYSPHPTRRGNSHHPGIISLAYKTIELLPIADYVVSDYSSVIYEAGLAGKPVFLYAYDWDEYSKKRSFNLNFEKDVPAFFSKDAEDIVKAIEINDFDSEEFQKFLLDNVVIPEEGCAAAIVNLIIDGKSDKNERHNERNIKR